MRRHGNCRDWNGITCRTGLAAHLLYILEGRVGIATGRDCGGE